MVKVEVLLYSKRYRKPKWKSRMDNTEALASFKKQNKDKQNKEAQYHTEN